MPQPGAASIASQVGKRDKESLLAANGLHVLAAAKPSGKRRSVLLGALPHDLANALLLHHAILWAAGKEKHLKQWFCENPNTDCALDPQSGKLVVVNYTDRPQTTRFFDGRERSARITLKPYQSCWLQP